MVSAHTDCKSTDLEIAIVGMAGRFSGSQNLRQFWQNLLEGREGISFFSEDELLASGTSPHQLRRANYVNAAGILEDCELFDRDFFGITPKEAELIDPQHRVFLECAWEAFEDAGYVPNTFPGLVGVFAGTALSSYFLNHVLPNMEKTAALGLFLTSVSNDKDYLPTRTSYKLNLKGPSVSVGTACSTSLVATHLACKSLLAGECDMALAGGAALHFPIKDGYLYQEGGILSPDGHCRAFDERAQGTVCGSGVAAVLLKRLDEAIEDRDHIYAVIKGSAINNDGYRKVGFTAPSVEGQVEVIRLAHIMAGVNPETISYVEAHGTGTPIGDPIELQALTEAFRTATKRNQFCAIGSVKTNIGHVLEAAGVAGLIKTALALKHRKLPPSLHFTKPNAKLSIESTPFYVNDKLQDWRDSGAPLRAGVSSFGIGGTNAHMVLEEAPPIPGSPSSRNFHLLTISARSRAALEQATARLCLHLEQNRDIHLGDVAFTLHSGRKAFDHRRVLVCSSRENAMYPLKTHDGTRLLSNDGMMAEPGIALVFSAEAPLNRQAAAELYRTEAVFRKHADSCLDLLTPEIKPQVANFFASDSSSRVHGSTADVQDEVLPTHQALFITEFALAQLWKHWGLEAKAVIGCGIGEFVAGCVAGIFSLQDALRIIALRQKLIQSLPAEHPSSLPQSGIMNSTASLFAEVLQRFQMSPPKLPYLSSITGEWITSEQACSARFWTEQLRGPVRLGDAFAKLLNQGTAAFLEVGPARETRSFALTGSAVEDKQKPILLCSLPGTHQNEPAISVLLSCVGKLWLKGWTPNWEKFHEGERRSRIPLPTYPFERSLCRLASGASRPSAVVTAKVEPLASGEATAHDAGFVPVPTPLTSDNADLEIPVRAELQRQIADSWRQLLGVEQIGPDDDFFDLGGDSLLVTQFVSRLSQTFQIELPLDKVYDSPTVANIATVLETLILQKLEALPDNEASRTAALS